MRGFLFMDRFQGESRVVFQSDQMWFHFLPIGDLTRENGLMYP